jgi:N-carbamoyl-L-amino-acid hydrolase
MSLTVNAARLKEDLQTLGGIGRSPGGGITRTSFSAADADARSWYAARCRDAGLSLRVDALGNMLADDGSDPSVPAVWSGSHIDTVPDGGAFDGAVGVVAALEAVRRLAEEGLALQRPLRAAVFADEEGNYSPLFGSSALARGYGRDRLASMVGRDGDRLIDAMSTAGWDVDSALDVAVHRDPVFAFVELHIEQGPKLEAMGTEIGVVTSIIGLGEAVVEFHGRADHAGTMPMTERHDPLRAAADLIAALASIAASTSDAAVVTCGRLETRPGGANVVPSLVRLTLDFRDPDAANVAALAVRLEQHANEAARTHGVGVTWLPDPVIPPMQLDERVRSTISRTAAELGRSMTAIPSGAGHDSQNIAQLAPAGMIFIPSRGGRSHCPEEDTDWPDVINGANVLLNTLAELATRPSAELITDQSD